MSNDDDPPRRFVRARQRDPNSSWRGFAANLDPEYSEIGVDRLQVSLRGTWSSISGQSFFQNLMTHPAVDWFNRPERTSHTSVRLSKISNGSTLSDLKIHARNSSSTGGTITVEATLNPTRTLAHLQAKRSFGVGGDWQAFLADIEAYPPYVFFEKETSTLLQQSLDRADNFLAVSIAPNPAGWTQFLGLFVSRFRQLLIPLLCEAATDQNIISADGIDTYRAGDGLITLHWANVRVPQIECYFERYHRAAVSAVRRGGWAVLAADHSARLRNYSDPLDGDHEDGSEPETFQRLDDAISVGLPINQRYRLEIYAKLATRMRFEVRRLSKGDYRQLPENLSHLRLLDIIEHERRETLRLINWPQVGELFAGPDYPTLHDFGYLVGRVCAIIGDDHAEIADVIRRLVIDGSIEGVEPENRVRTRTIRRLEKEKIVSAVPIRARDLNGRRRRYALTAPYRDIHAHFSDPLLQNLLQRGAGAVE